VPVPQYSLKFDQFDVSYRAIMRVVSGSSFKVAFCVFLSKNIFKFFREGESEFLRPPRER
jgi:hypothetical protein